MTKEQVKAGWDYLQSLLDIDGDVWMGAWTAVMIWRIAGAFFGHPAVTTAEALAYGSAVTAFAYSNKGATK